MKGAFQRSDSKAQYCRALWLHESGTYVKFTDSGAALFV
jgi:hypothetical protein